MLLFGIAAGLLIQYYSEKMLKDDLVRLSDVIKDEAQRENADLSNLVSFENSGSKAFRISFIDSQGNIVADSFKTEEFENHLDRPEVQSALSGNPEFVKRYSETLGKDLMYYAVAFTFAGTQEAYVLRVAIESSAVSEGTLSAIPLLLVITAVLAFALIFTNHKYNNASVQPLLELKSQLHTINTGGFQKLTVDKSNRDLLPIINELNEIAENINALNKVRSEFFANASHELNTPLTYISGYAELMEEGLLTDKDKISECGAKIREQSMRMENLISDMLKLSSLENTPSDIAMEEVKIKELLYSITDTLKLAAAERKLTVNVYCYAEVIISNEKLLKDILTNLIQNAIKYNKENGRIDITVRKNKKRVEINVADTGIGIADGDSLRIFERFYRVDKGRSRQSGGTGLGLAIVKHSVQRLGGTVKLESRIGEGSNFTVTLPEQKTI